MLIGIKVYLNILHLPSFNLNDMQRILLLSFFFSISFHALISQSCFPNGLTLTTQEEIDNFSINYPTCFEIEGGLWIYGESIINLDGLSQITSIGGELRIGKEFQEIFIEDLSGLENLTSINSFRIENCLSIVNFNELISLTEISYLYIENNSSLTSLNFPNQLESHRLEYLIIKENDLIENFEGLSTIDTIAGNCIISDNLSLQNFSGLDNLKMTRDLIISGNSSLQNLSNLNSLTKVFGTLNIIENNLLLNFDGLQNLVSINASNTGGLIIDNNNSLLSLYGLNNITSVHHGFHISNNENLVSISALSNLISMNVYSFFSIINNSSLISLSGIDNFQNEQLVHLNIEDNSSLSYCAVQCVCDYLGGEGAAIFPSISNNAAGCNSVEEVEYDCANGMPCYIGDIELSSQFEVDNYSINYPNCNIVYGDLIIEGDDIENLDGLSQIAQINGSLYVGILNGNPVLTDISGLSTIATIDGSLWIVFNEELEDLYGLHNIAPSSIESIEITDNAILSDCSIQNFCEFLNQNDPEAVFAYNSDGCNSIGEVQNACVTGVNEIEMKSVITIYPNPSRNILNIEVSSFELMETIQIFDQIGKLVYSGPFNNSIDVSHLKSGLYILKIEGPTIQFRENFFKA